MYSKFQVLMVNTKMKLISFKSLEYIVIEDHFGYLIHVSNTKLGMKVKKIAFCKSFRLPFSTGATHHAI